MIYFIKRLDSDGDIKIGYTERIDKRFSQLQVGNSKKLQLLFVMEGDINTEKHLHKIFKQYHIRGDWHKKEVYNAFLNHSF